MNLAMNLNKEKKKIIFGSYKQISILIIINPSFDLLPGNGARHVWQKHCITESRTNPINIFAHLFFFLFNKKITN
jgi:hypothetical protein